MKRPGKKLVKHSQRGSFVLEALIAILLFAIGILAIIGLQAASIKNTAGAKYRTDASLLANQIIGQMWIADKSYADPTVPTPAALPTNFCGPAVPGVCDTAGPNYLAWANQVAQTLPGASGANAPTISINANNQVTVTVFWQTPDESSPHNYIAVTNVND